MSHAMLTTDSSLHVQKHSLPLFVAIVYKQRASKPVLLLKRYETLKIAYIRCSLIPHLKSS